MSTSAAGLRGQDGEAGEAAVERPVVSFGIYREDGLYLGLASTDTAGFHTGRFRGTGEELVDTEAG